MENNYPDETNLIQSTLPSNPDIDMATPWGMCIKNVSSSHTHFQHSWGNLPKPWLNYPFASSTASQKLSSASEEVEIS